MLAYLPYESRIDIPDVIDVEVEGIRKDGVVLHVGFGDGVLGTH